MHLRTYEAKSLFTWYGYKIEKTKIINSLKGIYTLPKSTIVLSEKKAISLQANSRGKIKEAHPELIPYIELEMNMGASICKPSRIKSEDKIKEARPELS